MMKKIHLSFILLLLCVFLLPASGPLLSASLPVVGYYYGDDSQGDSLTFMINTGNLMELSNGVWTGNSVPDITITENEAIPENGYVYDAFSWSLTGRYTGTVKIKFTFWCLEASFLRGGNTYYTIPSHHEYLLYLPAGAAMSIVKGESTLNMAGNNLKGFKDTSGIWEQKNTPYISGVAESTLISKGYVKYITYTGTFDGGVGESGNVRLRITRVNALAELIQYHGTVRVEITTGT